MQRLNWPRAVGGGVALALCIGVGTAWAGGGITVKEGDKAPEVDLPAIGVASVFPDKKDAKTLNLNAFKGKKHVVLWFYPKALTGG